MPNCQILIYGLKQESNKRHLPIPCCSCHSVALVSSYCSGHLYPVALITLLLLPLSLLSCLNKILQFDKVIGNLYYSENTFKKTFNFGEIFSTLSRFFWKNAFSAFDENVIAVLGLHWIFFNYLWLDKFPKYDFSSSFRKTVIFILTTLYANLKVCIIFW